jgi:hypothetical protein
MLGTTSVQIIKLGVSWYVAPPYCAVRTFV